MFEASSEECDFLLRMVGHVADGDAFVGHFLIADPQWKPFECTLLGLLVDSDGVSHAPCGQPGGTELIVRMAVPDVPYIVQFATVDETIAYSPQPCLGPAFVVDDRLLQDLTWKVYVFEC